MSYFGEISASEQHGARVITSRAILSNSTLQQFLYYNSYFSIVWTVLTAFILRVKYLTHSGNPRAQTFTPILYGFWVLVEFIRLYIGFVGNLKEQTSQLASFLFLTFFPQLFITIYMLYIQDPLLPIDLICNYIYLVVLILELISCWRTIANIIAHKTARFQIEFGADNDSHPVQPNQIRPLNDGPELYDSAIPDQQLQTEETTEESEGLFVVQSPPKRQLPKKKPANPHRLNQGTEPAIELTTTLPLPSPPPTAAANPNLIDPYAAYIPPSRAGLRGSTAPGIDTASITNNRAIYTAQPNLGVTSPITPTAATFGNESDDEKIRRRMRDRAIIRGEFDRKKDRSRPTTAGSLRQTADITEAELSPDNNINNAAISTAEPSSYQDTSNTRPYTGRDGVRKQLSAEEILSRSQARQSSAQARREYVQQVDRKFSTNSIGQNEEQVDLIPTRQISTASAIPLSTSRPANLQLYQRLISGARAGRPATAAPNIYTNNEFTSGENINPSSAGELVQHNETIQHIENTGRNTNIDSSAARLLTGLEPLQTRRTTEEQSNLLAKKDE